MAILLNVRAGTKHVNITIMSARVVHSVVEHAEVFPCVCICLPHWCAMAMVSQIHNQQPTHTYITLLGKRTTHALLQPTFDIGGGGGGGYVEPNVGS